MSFILDALRKSETERQQQSGGEFSSVPTSSGNAQSLKWLWLLAALLGVNLAVLAGILLRPDTPPAAPAPVESPQEAAGVAPQTEEPSFAEQLETARQAQAERRQSASEAAETATTSTAADEGPAIDAPQQSSGRILTFDELRLTGALQLGDLHLDIHVYSENPAERFVFINMDKLREHSQLKEGPVVDEITPEGVILDYQGMTFLLPRE